jgi:hypothetical protein
MGKPTQLRPEESPGGLEKLRCDSQSDGQFVGGVVELDNHFKYVAIRLLSWITAQNRFPSHDVRQFNYSTIKSPAWKSVRTDDRSLPQFNLTDIPLIHLGPYTPSRVISEAKKRAWQ